MENLLVFLLISLTALLHGDGGHVAGSEVHHIRGIPFSKNSLYPPNRDFQCFDGSLKIPFKYVNDDYCDCADGSDEPGTAACTNGSFYCRNSGHQPIYIPSTWVNDGVCDCCDASDEYDSTTRCDNICQELGKEAMLEAQRAADLAREGNKIRLEMVARGKQIRSDNQARLSKLQSDHEEAELSKKEKEVLKTQAEERETIALEKYKPAPTPEPEQPAEESTEDPMTQALNYFKFLDSDSDQKVSLIEIQTRILFDQNHDGIVSEEEAFIILNEKNEVDFKEFVDKSWPLVKVLLLESKGATLAPGEGRGEAIPQHTVRETQEEEAEPKDEEAEPKDEEEEIDADNEEEEGEEHFEQDDVNQEPAETEPVQTIEYDEETQSLIDESKRAREVYQEAESAVTALLDDIRKTQEKIERDYGSEDEFATLDGDCFEYSDSEYTYSLCMFDKASQRSKSGGGDIGLGFWSQWAGPNGNEYSKMKFDRGLTCWNGPSRSTLVTLKCGTENKLLSVSEPSRCEYAMEFSTPALCNPNIERTDMHDEL